MRQAWDSVLGCLTPAPSTTSPCLRERLSSWLSLSSRFTSQVLRQVVDIDLHFLMEAGMKLNHKQEDA